jgi:hypothetical protein
MQIQVVPILCLMALACGGAEREAADIVPATGGDVPASGGEQQTLRADAQRATADAESDSGSPVAVVPSDRVVLPSEYGAGSERDAGAEHDAGTRAPDPKRARWQALAPATYVVLVCGYGLAIPACSLEAVQDGHLVAKEFRFLPDDPWQPTSIEVDEDPIEGLFAQLDSPTDGCRLSYELDPVYAYPSEVYTDCGEEGWGTRVSCFEPDTLDLDQCRP